MFVQNLLKEASGVINGAGHIHNFSLSQIYKIAYFSKLNLEENFAKLHLPDWQFYLPVPLGNGICWALRQSIDNKTLLSPIMTVFWGLIFKIFTLNRPIDNPWDMGVFLGVQSLTCAVP